MNLRLCFNVGGSWILKHCPPADLVKAWTTEWFFYWNAESSSLGKKAIEAACASLYIYLTVRVTFSYWVACHFILFEDCRQIGVSHELFWHHLSNSVAFGSWNAWPINCWIRLSNFIWIICVHIFPYATWTLHFQVYLNSSLLFHNNALRFLMRLRLEKIFCDWGHERIELSWKSFCEFYSAFKNEAKFQQKFLRFCTMLDWKPTFYYNYFVNHHSIPDFPLNKI